MSDDQLVAGATLPSGGGTSLQGNGSGSQDPDYWKYLDDISAGNQSGVNGIANQLNSNEFYAEEFVNNLVGILGSDYYFGGGNIDKYLGLTNKDSSGNWLGYDCCGGVIYALEKTINKEIQPLAVNDIMNVGTSQGWLIPINQSELKPGDLIFQDYSSQGYSVGSYDHVYTWVGEAAFNSYAGSDTANGFSVISSDANIISTEFASDPRPEVGTHGITAGLNYDSFMDGKYGYFGDTNVQQQFFRIDFQKLF